jgi:hypothetical protein
MNDKKNRLTTSRRQMTQLGEIRRKKVPEHCSGAFNDKEKSMNLGTATNLDLDNSLERRFALRAD